jgi:hypothetical protein
MSTTCTAHSMACGAEMAHAVACDDQLLCGRHTTGRCKAPAALSPVRRQHHCTACGPGLEAGLAWRGVRSVRQQQCMQRHHVGSMRWMSRALQCWQQLPCQQSLGQGSDSSHGKLQPGRSRWPGACLLATHVCKGDAARSAHNVAQALPCVHHALLERRQPG